MSETTADTGWVLRSARPEDEGFLETLYSRLHAADFVGVSLPEGQVRGLIQMQARAQRLGYLRDFPGARNSIITADTSPIGRMLVDARSNAVHLVDIALLPEWQGMGIGTELLRSLQAEARERAVPLQLTVLPQNRALRLYSRLGFQITSGGMQLGMEWRPLEDEQARQTASPDSTAREPLGITEAPGDLVTEFTKLTGRSFRPEGASFDITLDEVERHPAFGSGSFSLLFMGPLAPVLPQTMHVLRLLRHDGEAEREFTIFLGPVARVEDRIQYEAVFNL